MSERRKFTDGFGLGDEVSILRTRHGWHDGEIGGLITAITDYSCTVTGDKTCEGTEIEKPRDIHLTRKAIGPAPKKGPGRHSRK